MTVGCEDLGTQCQSVVGGLGRMSKQCALIRRPLESRILFLRSRRVVLDSDLADLYRVTVKRLNQQVKRNAERFPEDFMFRLTPSENKLLRLQIATSNGGHGGRRYPPFVFTEHGALMAASVLNSPRRGDGHIRSTRLRAAQRDVGLESGTCGEGDGARSPLEDPGRSNP